MGPSRDRRRRGTEQKGEIDMDETRKQFIEPEIVKHDETMADVTAMSLPVGSDATIGDLTTQ
jgi:hypothetical protein